MRELTKHELYNAIAYAKSIDEYAGRQILDRFQLDQTALAQTIFGIFPMVIAEQDKDMSHLFMDLCFDVICVFEKAFGPLPSQSEFDIDWLEKQAVLLDTELQAMLTDNNMDTNFRNKMQNRFIQREIKDNPQPGLVKFMNMAIDDFASESPNRVNATRVTQTMIYVVIRLLSNLYNHEGKK